MKRQQEITLGSLPVYVQTALKLLKKRRRKALKGIGNYEIYDCPVACAYDINATVFWGMLDSIAQNYLIKNGWKRHIYNHWMQWYEVYDGPKEEKKRKRKERFLRKFLGT